MSRQISYPNSPLLLFEVVSQPPYTFASDSQLVSGARTARGNNALLCTTRSSRIFQHHLYSFVRFCKYLYTNMLVHPRTKSQTPPALPEEFAAGAPRPFQRAGPAEQPSLASHLLEICCKVYQMQKQVKQCKCVDE